MMEKKVDPESCGQLQSAMFKQKETSALRIYRSLMDGRIKRERSTYLSMKVPNANWPQSKQKLCVPLKDVIHSSSIIIAALERGSWTKAFEILA